MIPSENSIVMVADNYAPIRDMQLLDKLVALKIPVNIIICGSNSGNIHYSYLQLAAATGGSIHTIEEDI